jgi:multiple sugar transport system substrate-binding protein
MNAYVGLTWNHPRGFRALDASAQRWSSGAFEIRWDRQSLEEFEARSISDICSDYDLVVLDHPHIGDAVKTKCLVPLEEWSDVESIAKLEESTIGRTLASYFYQGSHWALPLDAATQVLAFRADLIPPGFPMRNWTDICELAERTPVILSLAGPHALLTFFSICVAFGEAPSIRDGDPLVSREVGDQALDLMARLFARMDHSTIDWNPITILEQMATTDSVACCPLVYGYVNYAASDRSDRHPINFANAPRVEKIGLPGSTLGGTGIAVSRRARLSPELRAYLWWLVQPETQRTFITHWDGQPSSRTAWFDQEANRCWNGFYRQTVETIEQAWIRPRFPGYIRLQSEASELLRSSLRSGLSGSETFDQLTHLCSRCRSD